MDVMDTLQRDRETIQRMRGRVRGLRREREEWGGGGRFEGERGVNGGRERWKKGGDSRGS